MSEDSNIKRLGATPVTELNLGSAGLRRTIQRAGFDTLPKLLNLSEEEIDNLFDFEVADSILALREKYHADPNSFATSVLQKRAKGEASIKKAPPQARISHGDMPKMGIPAVSRICLPDDVPVIPSLTPSSDTLRIFERRAKEVFDDLDDRFEDVMVYQAFEEFSTNLDELSEAFSNIFNYYLPRTALSLIEKHFRNAFIVYVADRARNVYSDGNLWGNFFEDLGIRDGNVQGLFKKIFTNHIERRGMPLYARNEEANYYFYTALLHGGLSTDSWSNLWEKCILPLARETAAGHYGFGGEMDGRLILKELKNPESRFAPKKAVLNILEKAPGSTIAPLFEASMRVAMQVENSKNTRDGYMMLSNFGLPETAMNALRMIKEQAVPVARSQSTSSPRERRQSGQGIICLPMASLQLDLARGIVSIRWPRQQFPMHFAGMRIEYYVDGKMELSSEFSIDVGKCILEASSIDVKPQVRYDIELRLMQKDDRTDEYTEVSSLAQAFTRSKPGCFEFIRDAKGLYRLRGRSERIIKRRRIAYIVKDGYRVNPGQGMKAVSEYETSGEWGGAQIFIYDVDPGSAGSIVNNLTGEEVAVWQERYTAKIDKRHVIGETVDGVDLYGYIPCELGTNGGLPSVTIEAIDGSTALEDLEIMCVCDGRRVSIPRHVMWEDNCDESNAAQIALVPQKTNGFGFHIKECLIEARQKSAAGKAVFRYKFAVIPIQDFRPLSINFDFGIAVAEYGFQALHAIDVTNDQGETETVNAWGRYTTKAPLKQEFLHLCIQSRESGEETDVRLALAAIDIKIPNALVKISEKRPVCLADALKRGPSAARFEIVADKWRRNRAVMVKLGDEPLFLRELKQPGRHEFNLFRHAAPFNAASLQQADNSRPNSCPLMLCLVYGDDVTQGSLKPAWTDVKMLDCAKGIGIYGWRLLTTAEGKHVLRFDGQPICDAHFEFKRKIGEKLVAEASVKAGSTELALPQNVVRLLNVRKTIIVDMSPSVWSGDIRHEHTTRFILER